MTTAQGFHSSPPPTEAAGQLEPGPEKRSSHSRTAIIAIVIALGLGTGVWLLAGRTKPASSAQPPPAVPVTATAATRQDVPEIVDAIGTVQSIDSVAIEPRVSGAIQKIEFTPGQDVRKGQELFLIDPRPYQAALDQTKAQMVRDRGVLAEAQTDLKRYQTLEKENSIAVQQAQDQVFVVAQDKGTVQLDQANIEAAQLNIAYCHITAPVSGRAGTLQVDVGNLVSPPTGSNSSASASTASSGLVSITQLEPIYVTFAIPQTSLNQIKQNQASGALDVDVYSQAGKLLEKGKLTVIDNQINVSAGTVTMQATFANADESLWPGQFVRIQLVVGIRKDVITVPTPAVMAGPNGSYVYVVGANDHVKRVAVTVAFQRDGVSVIGKGLSAGENVVTNGQYRLENGTKVAIRKEATQPPADGVSEAQAQ